MGKTLRFPSIFLLFILVLSLAGCASGEAGLLRTAVSVEFTDDGAAATDDAVSIATEDDGAVTVTICTGGAYRLTGSCANGAVIVDCAADVTLLLDALTLTHPDGACIASIGDGTLTICPVSGTESSLTDGTGYQFTDPLTDVPDAVLFAQGDLRLTGSDTGILHIRALYKTGIASRDMLCMEGGTYTISSIRHGMHGRDGIAISGGFTAIEAAADGMRTTNDKPGKEGTVAITGGKVTILAGDEGIQSVGNVTFSGGTTAIDSTNNGLKTEGMLQVTGGTVSIGAADEALLAAETAHTGGSFSVNGADYADWMGAQ